MHHNIAGFGSKRPPANVTHYPFARSIGLQFNYHARPVIRTMHDQARTTKNIHMYVRPAFTWSCVTFGKNRNLYISVDFLPLERHKTRWFVTVSHNYLTSPIERKFVEMAARAILFQDQMQMRRQSKMHEMRSLFTFREELPFEVCLNPTKKHRSPTARLAPASPAELVFGLVLPFMAVVTSGALIGNSATQEAIEWLRDRLAVNYVFPVVADLAPYIVTKKSPQ